MLNKFLLLIILIVISDCVMAQHINLQKINSYNTLKIKLPKKVVIKYLKDSAIQTIEAKAIAYKFPNLMLVQKNDTIILNVQKILSINYKPIFSVGYYILMLPVSVLAGTFIGVAFVDKTSSNFAVDLLLGISFVFTDNYLFNEANKKLDTKEVWSFY